MSGLSYRQLVILALAAEGCGNRAIARRLRLSESTIKNHLTVAYKKLGVRNRTGAVAALYREAAA